MELQDRNYDEILRRIAREHCIKILRIDVRKDKYECMLVDDEELRYKNENVKTDNLSDWFEYFINGPLCHDNDKERLERLLNLNRISDELDKNGNSSLNIVYRRKIHLSDTVYSLVCMEIIPYTNEDGSIEAILHVRAITSEIQRYNDTVTKGLRDKIRSDKKSVLIVEDNEMNREILSCILSEKYGVLEAENGLVGLQVLQQHLSDISVVVLDVQMPVMNGYEFLETIANDPFMSRIPVVVATGSDSIEEEQKCLKLGASDFVTKPYNPDIIMSRISGIIRLRESAATMSVLQTDERTGLYTLQAFYYYARMALDKNTSTQYSVTIFDVDHFKHVNETYGEAYGDKVLVRIADVLRNYTAASDIYGRFGAARFLILSETMSDEKTDFWIKELFRTLSEKCGIKGITFKAGIYNNIDRNLSISSICDRATVALNSTGHNFENRYSIYDEVHAEKERRLSQIESDMWDAYNNDQFKVYYQPKHEASSGRLIGAEALIRWIHPVYGFLSPMEFVPLFEKNGFVSYADYYVLKRTCMNMRKWIDEGIGTVPVSINASRRDFERENYVKTVMAPLKENGIDPSMIHIEVTESFFSDRMDEISEILKECRDEGFEVELDDFGSGYSSLTTLTILPLDVIKLDMSFMRNYENEKRRKVLSTCIGLAKSLGLKTVSEGVETIDQLEFLRKCGCDWIQGYYFSKPIPEEEFKEYLIKHQDR